MDSNPLANLGLGLKVSALSFLFSKTGIIKPTLKTNMKNELKEYGIMADME